MSQKEEVKNAMRMNGGYATLSYLYRIIDTSSWGTKTPDASIRRIVQDSGFLKLNQVCGH